MTDKEFDVVIWGASGFTGRLVSEYMYKTYGNEISWAMAGRSESKLAEVRDQITGGEGADIPLLIANSDDEDSIRQLVAQTRVVCTTVGPYARYGSGLVAVCAESGTHYCDLTGEVQWMRRMIDQHQFQATESGAKIVHTCGFDSIPSDLGVHYLQGEMFKAHGVYASRVKFGVVNAQGGMSGGTVDSLMNLMEEARTDPTIMELMADPYALNPANMPRGEDNNDITSAEYDFDFGQWTAPFAMAGINTRVVRRSHALKGYPWGRGFRYGEVMLMGAGPAGFSKASVVAGGTLMMMAGAAFSPTRSLLKTMLPSPGEGPSPEAIANGFYEIDLLGRHPDDRSSDITVRVTGDRDPGYGSTSKMLAESAVCLAMDTLESEGGVMTPSVSMGDHLVNRLQEKAGMTFSVLDK